MSNIVCAEAQNAMEPDIVGRANLKPSASTPDITTKSYQIACALRQQCCFEHFRRGAYVVCEVP